MKNSNKLIVITGTSGVGKTTLVEYLLSCLELNLAFSISACSRKKRHTERNGKNYIFLSKSDFKKKIEQDCFIEWEEVYPGQFYGTLKESIDNMFQLGKNILFDIDVKGAMSIKETFQQQVSTIFIKPPTIIEAKKRLINRQTESEKSLKKRIKKMESELKFAKNMDVQLVNDDLEITKKRLYTHVKSFLIK